MADHDSWDDPKYLKPADCDELGYCVHCRTATVHKADCVVVVRDKTFHVLHEAADRLEHYLNTYEPSTAARIAGHQLADELRKLAER